MHYIILLLTPIGNAVILTKMSLLLRLVTTAGDCNTIDSNSSDVLIKKLNKTVNAASVTFIIHRAAWNLNVLW